MTQHIDPAKPRRAPRGYIRGALQEFHLTGPDGHAAPVIKVQCYINTTTGYVIGFGLIPGDGRHGRLEAENMASWRAAVAKALEAKITAGAPTRHIAVVCSAAGGKYHLRFWPVWRQIALDKSEHWADLEGAENASYWLHSSGEIDWGEVPCAQWSTSRPWTWDGRRIDAKILDWSPENWDGLIAIRRSLDAAIEKIGELVTDPRALSAHVVGLLGPGIPACVGCGGHCGHPDCPGEPAHPGYSR